MILPNCRRTRLRFGSASFSLNVATHPKYLKSNPFIDVEKIAMGLPRHFTIPKGCLRCTLRQASDFCNLPQPLMSEFNAIGPSTLYPTNSTLLMEGQRPRGVYMACSGRSKLSWAAMARRSF